MNITESGNIRQALDEYDTRFLPFGVALHHRAGYLNIEQWWQDRSIPASRDGLDQLLNKLGLLDQRELLVKNFGLSLSDQYWIKPEGKNIEWRDINFFDNAFSEDVGKIAFSENIPADPREPNLVSPDNTSDGWLKKNG